MRIIGISGSPRSSGNTEILIKEVLQAVEGEGVETEYLSLATLRVKPCQSCWTCTNTLECAIKDDAFADIYLKMLESDGFVLGSPVYVGSATPQMMSLIHRAMLIQMANNRAFAGKVGAAVAVAWRAGHNFTVAQMNYFFQIAGMYIPGSTYWNVAFGEQPGEVLKDERGLQTMRALGKNMAVLVKQLKK